MDDIGMLLSGPAAADAFPCPRRRLRMPRPGGDQHLHPSGHDTITPKRLATAGVDQLLHHAHVIVTEEASLRLTEATAGKGWCR
jgi:hypothetical protein